MTASNMLVEDLFYFFFQLNQLEDSIYLPLRGLLSAPAPPPCEGAGLAAVTLPVQATASKV